MKKILSLFLLAFMVIMPHVSAEIDLYHRGGYHNIVNGHSFTLYNQMIEVNSTSEESKRFTFSKHEKLGTTDEYETRLSLGDTVTTCTMSYDPIVTPSGVDAIAVTSDNLDNPESLKSALLAFKLVFKTLDIPEKQFDHVIFENHWHDYSEYIKLKGDYYPTRFYRGQYTKFYVVKQRREFEIMKSITKDNRIRYTLYIARK